METFTKTMRDLSKNKLAKWSVYMPKGTNINLNFEQQQVKIKKLSTSLHV